MVRKIAIIMFIFSFATLFGMYEVNKIYNNATISQNWGESQVNKTAASMGALSKVNNGQSPNAALIFGDFLIGATVLFNLFLTVISGIAGTGIVAMFQGFPGFDIGYQYLVEILYGSSNIILWVYIISFRSV